MTSGVYVRTKPPWNKGVKGLKRFPRKPKGIAEFALNRLRAQYPKAQIKVLETKRTNNHNRSESMKEAWKKGNYDYRTICSIHKHNGHWHRSKQELIMCNVLTSFCGDSLIPNFRIGRHEIDWVQIDEKGRPINFFEFHPWDRRTSLKNYSESRRKIIEARYPLCPLIVIGTSVETPKEFMNLQICYVPK